MPAVRPGPGRCEREGGADRTRDLARALAIRIGGGGEALTLSLARVAAAPGTIKRMDVTSCL